MNATQDSTIVIFRKWLGHDVMGDDTIALFPAEPASASYCASFEHIGQHGAADYRSVIARTAPAMPIEYAALKRELESASYNYKLVVRTRYQRSSNAT